MCFIGSRTRDEGWTCGLGHHDTDKIDTTNSVGMSDQWIPLSRQGDTRVGCGMGKYTRDIGDRAHQVCMGIVSTGTLVL